MIRKAITTVLAPNYQGDDVRRSLGLLLRPWQWRTGKAVRAFEQEFQEWLPCGAAISFGSGRGALWEVLRCVRLQPGDEVLLQAFTCVSVPDAVLWAGGKPVYVDTDAATYTMDVEDFKRKISPRSRAVIIQHTFGYPANIDAICATARAHGMFIVEDCAHALGATYRGKRVGRFGHAAIFSFGRDKVISSVFGGMAVTDDPAVANQLRLFQQEAKLPPSRWIVQQLMHPVVTFFARQTLEIFSVGKIILRLARTTHVTALAVGAGEREGKRPELAGYRMPNALAVIARRQFRKLDRYNRHRAVIAEIYRAGLAHRAWQLPPAGDTQRTNINLLYTIRTRHAETVLQSARRHGVYLEEWYRPVIAPPGVENDTIGYTPGSCPRAEAASNEVVNLPTHMAVSEPDARRICTILSALKF
ncbi:MAG: aminotransferase class I/II-fold pyridoxal phosphate-dependent enzyme [Patescibacteria group bacterium]|nr:aminotransferase class I/II-fold pyridoxal phosphate-dependent enzyme [Patescibacteria group bacterium]